MIATTKKVKKNIDPQNRNVEQRILFKVCYMFNYNVSILSKPINRVFV